MAYQLTEKDKEWIAYLRANPDKKGQEELGTIYNGEIVKACCLGARHYIENRNLPNGPIVSFYKFDISSELNKTDYQTAASETTLVDDYKKYNLRGELGQLEEYVRYEDRLFCSLAEMNDSDIYTWPQIADYIENNPDNIFRTYDEETTQTQTT